MSKLLMELDVEHWDGTKHRVTSGASDRIAAEAHFGGKEIGGETWLAFLAFAAERREGKTTETDFDKWCGTLLSNAPVEDEEPGESEAPLES